MENKTLKAKQKEIAQNKQLLQEEKVYLQNLLQRIYEQNK